MPDPVEGAAAAQPSLLGDPAPNPRASGPRQPSLFAGQKVIPFDALVSTRRQYGRKYEPPRPPEGAPVIAQPVLELRPTQAEAAEQHTAYGEAGAAPPALRARAALADLLFCAIGLTVFAATARVMGMPLSFGPKALPLIGATLPLTVLFYHVFFAMLGRETPGMGCYHLRVVTFDGSRAKWTLRLARLACACLSASAFGLGLVWTLVDPEGLGWHDHITKSFPTVRQKK